MSKSLSFVNVFVPKEQYKERYEIGNRTFVYIDAVYNEKQNAYECVECSVNTSEYDAAEIMDAYKSWKERLAKKALERARKCKLAEIDSYDTSTAVNGFELNGQTVWLDKATRVGLMNSTTIAKAMGNDTTVLWLGDMRIEVGCDKAIQLLSALEMYALECFNVTAAHKKAVSALGSVEDVEAFDVTEGYPVRLSMTV